jgi:L-asparagine oxygenase
MKNIIRLPDQLSRQYRRAAATIRIAELDPRAHLDQARQLAQEYLTAEIQGALEEFRQPNGPAYLLIENLPNDPDLCGPGPIDGRRPAWKETWVAEYCILGILAGAGLEVLAFMEEYGGDLIQQLAPSPGLELHPTGTGRTPLRFHVDNAILSREFRPEGLILFGVKSSERAQTPVARLDDILRKLDSRHIDILCRPYYAVKSPPSFHRHDRSHQVLSAPRPVLYQGPRGEMEIQYTFISGEIVANHEEAEQALRAFHDTLTDEVADPVEVVPGTALLINNHRALHSRGEVRGERWVMRAYGRASLAQLEAANPTSRRRPPHRYFARDLMRW